MFDKFIEQLKCRMLQPLPGEEVQYQMSPVGRPRLKDLSMSVFSPQKSAVLILLFPHEQTIKTALIVRPVYNGVHSGQVAFPGGKFEQGDIHLMQTALREAHEEIGVLPEEVSVMGNLTDVYINPSNFLVTPFIGYTHKHPDFIANASEVEKIITYDVMDLNKPDIKLEKKIKLSFGLKVNAPYYDIKGETVWGATAMMISELNVLIEEARTISL